MAWYRWILLSEKVRTCCFTFIAMLYYDVCFEVFLIAIQHFINLLSFWGRGSLRLRSHTFAILSFLPICFLSNGPWKVFWLMLRRLASLLMFGQNLQLRVSIFTPLFFMLFIILPVHLSSFLYPSLWHLDISYMFALLLTFWMLISTINHCYWRSDIWRMVAIVQRKNWSPYLRRYWGNGNLMVIGLDVWISAFPFSPPVSVCLSFVYYRCFSFIFHSYSFNEVHIVPRHLSWVISSPASSLILLLDCTMDNASVNTLLSRILGIPSLPCWDHFVHLAISDSKDVAEVWIPIS